MYIFDQTHPIAIIACNITVIILLENNTYRRMLVEVDIYFIAKLLAYLAL